jgi:hypothetical protein
VHASAPEPRSDGRLSDALHPASRRAWLALGAAWALAWTAFAVAAAAGEGGASLPYAAAFVASLAAVLGAAWRWPRGGGVAAIAAGVVGAVLVDHGVARLLLFAPAVLLGVAALTSAPRRPRRAECPTSGESSALPGGTAPPGAPRTPEPSESRAARRLPPACGEGLGRNPARR